MHSAAKLLNLDCLKWIYSQDFSMLIQKNIDGEALLQYASRLLEGAFQSKTKKKFLKGLRKLDVKDGRLQSL